MHSIASVFSREKDRQCPTCRGTRRIYSGGKYVECYHCCGKGIVRLVE